MGNADSTQPNPTELLQRQELGSTGLIVDSLCLGCAPLGDMSGTFGYSVSEEQALATIRTFFDGPINFVDTAASYGDGEAERRIGLVIRERGGLPAGFVLATKADRNLQTGDFSGDQIRRSVERSLRLLGLDRLQLVYLHDPEHTSFEQAIASGGPVDALQRMAAEGVIAHIGVAGGPIDMSIRYVETGAFEVAITHNRYTLLNVSALPLLESAAQHGVALLNAAPYGSGILAKGPGAYPRYAYQDISADLRDRAEHIEEICRRYGVSLAAAALQFSLRDRRIVSTIVGMTRPERISQTRKLAKESIPEQMWAELAGVTPETNDPEEFRWTK